MPEPQQALWDTKKHNFPKRFRWGSRDNIQSKLSARGAKLDVEITPGYMRSDDDGDDENGNTDDI